MFKSLFMKKKKVAEKPMEVTQEPIEVIVEQPKPIIEKVEVKEEKQQGGVRTIVSHNG